MQIKFKQNAKITQPKSRRLPIQLQDAVQAEIDRLVEEGHYEKDKHQMPSLEHLVDPVAEQLDSEEQGKALYTSLDMC